MAGADPIGPPRQFFRDALADLPPEAKVIIHPNGTYSCYEPYRATRVYDLELCRLLGWPKPERYDP